MTKDRPPKYGEEVRRIAEEGLKKHRAKGNVVTFDGKIAGAETVDAQGKPTGRRDMNRKQRQRFIQLCQLAIAGLAEGRLGEWADSLEELQAIAQRHKWTHATFIDVCQQIEGQAVAITGNPHCGAYARHWMQRRRDVLRFLPTQGLA